MVSPRTVEKHLENVYRKLGVKSRVAAVILACQLGLVEPVAPADHLAIVADPLRGR